MAGGNGPTDTQEDAYRKNAATLDTVEEQLRKAQQEARARLKAAGIGVGVDDDDQTSCLKCGCLAYKATPHHPSAACARESCGHSWVSHHW